MKKLTAVIAALALIAGCTACAGGEKNTSGGNSSASSRRGGTVQTAAQTIYTEDRLAVPDDFYYPQGLAYAEDGSMLLIYNDMYFTVRAVRYDTELNMGESFVIEKGETEYLANFALTDAGLRAYSSRTVDGETLLSIRTFSADGKVVSTTELGDLDGHLDMNNILVNNVSFHGEDCLISFDRFAVIVDGSGKVTDYTDIENDATYTFGRDGGIICSFYKYSTRLDKLQNPKESELYENPNGSSVLRPPVIGDGDYPAYLALNDGVYGMSEEGEMVMLLNFTASNIKPSGITAIMPFGEGRFVACTGSGLLLLTVRPDDYKEERVTVIIGMHNHVNTSDLDLATDFASHCDGYQAEFREYDYDRDDLWADILADDSPDVYIPSTHNELYRYINLGALADFGELHENFGGLSEDDFLPNVVSGLKYKGKLYSMSGYFIPSLQLADRDVLSREQAKWNYDEFYGFVAAQPADMFIAEHYVMDEPTDVFSWLCGVNSADWIDYEKAECYFDSPGFVRLLEFCKNANCTGSYGNNYWETVSQEEIALDASENMSMLGRRKALFGNMLGGIRLDSFVNAAAAHSMSIDDVTFVSPPNNSRGGTFTVQGEYCVLTSGKCQQGGWEFVNYALSYDVQADPWQAWDFVTRKDAFDYILKTKFDTLNADDNEVSSGVNGYQFSYSDNITQEQLDYIRETVLSCDRLGVWDDKIGPILTEEFGRYIAGESSAKDCAKMIQNRVSIMLSEQS